MSQITLYVFQNASMMMENQYLKLTIVFSALFDSPIFEFKNKYKLSKSRYEAEQIKLRNKARKAKHDAKLAEKKGDMGR